MSYWRKREKEHMKKREKDVNKIARRLKKNQEQTMKEIEKEINAFYGRYASKEGLTIEEVKKKVSEFDIKEYEEKAKKYVAMSKSKDEETRQRAFTKSANDEMRLYNLTMRANRLELLKANIHLDLLSMRSYEERELYNHLINMTEGEYKRLAGMLGESVTFNAKKLASIVNSSFLTATWSDRLWKNQEALRLELNKLLNLNIVQGAGARKMAQKLRETFDTSVSASERLLRTETARVQTDVFLDVAKQLDIEKYEWIAEPSACPKCSALDGKVFYLTKGRWGTNLVPLHPNCMCALALVYEE